MPGVYCIVESRPPWSMKVLLRGVKDAHVFLYGIRFDVQGVTVI